jgi:preprotein translocase subunit SecF
VEETKEFMDLRWARKMALHFKGLEFVPQNTKIDFIGQRWINYMISIIVTAVTFGALLFHQGLNLGVDFTGGILIEIQTKEDANLAKLREQLHGLHLGESSLQEFGSPKDVLIRIGRQPGDEQAQMVAVEKVRASFGEDVSVRRVETVGPKMGEELVRNALHAIVWCMVAMLIYIWFRFEWHFAVCAIISLLHDAIAVLGLYALFRLEFNSQAIVAILITVGYSINDTVVIFDRIRENLRKYKALSPKDLLNQSINDTLSRTVLTSSTTLLSLLALYFFGGEVIADYSLPIIVGIIVGTYSSIFLSAPLLLFFNIRPKKTDEV